MPWITQIKQIVSLYLESLTNFFGSKMEAKEARHQSGDTCWRNLVP